MPSEVRSWLITMICEIETALAQYRVGGAVALRGALEAAAGHVLLSPESALAAENLSEGIWARTLSVLKTLRRAVLFAAGAAYLGSLAPGVQRTMPPRSTK